MKHKHADLLLQYALDAMETDEPWKRWETWEDAAKNWNGCSKFESLVDGWNYRRRPDAPPVPWHLLNESTRLSDVSKKPKPIDMSICIESGIDVESSTTGVDWYIDPSPEVSDTGCYWSCALDDWVDYCRPRLNHWHSWQGGECPVPEGLMGTVKFRNGLTADLANYVWGDWGHTRTLEDIIAFRVTGLADGYCWPWEDG